MKTRGGSGGVGLVYLRSRWRGEIYLKVVETAAMVVLLDGGGRMWVLV